MTNSRTPAPPARGAIGDNSQNALAGFVEDWHRLDRDDLFARGELLIRAHDTGQYTDWEKVCESEFGISHDTARNLMAIAKVAKTHENFRGLRVRKSTLYELAGVLEDGVQDARPDHDNLPVIIAALTEAAKAAGKTLSIDDAENVIYFTPLRKKFGADLPDATLIALKESVPADAEWGKGAIEQLKKDKPTTRADADAIVNAHHRAHIETIYEASLPAWFDKVEQQSVALRWLGNVPAEHRKEALEKLQDRKKAPSHSALWDIIYEFKPGGEPAASKPEPESGKPDEPKLDEPKSSDKPDKPGKSGGADVKALTKRVAQLEKALAGRDAEIQKLNQKLQMRAEAAPRGSADVGALIKKLKKDSNEARELVLEQMAKEFGFAPCLAVVVASLKTVDRKVAQTTLAKMAKDIGIAAPHKKAA
jgi:hypothetical protein